MKPIVSFWPESKLVFGYAIKGKRDREYKTYGVMQTLQTAYDTALELIDANEL